MNEKIPFEPEPYRRPYLEKGEKILLPCPPIVSPLNGKPIKYSNVNTGKMLHIVKTEVINQPCRVLELSDGSRWQETLFSRYWKIVSDD